jgi:hypothetical protein
MKRHVRLGPTQIDSGFGTLEHYLAELKQEGVPEEAKLQISTSAAGDVLVVVAEYDQGEDAEAAS